MKSKVVVVIGAILCLVFVHTGLGFSQEKVSGTEWTQIIEQIGDKGKINWSEGYIEAVGIGAPRERDIGKPQARPMALRAARIDAFRNLLEVTKGVRIDSATIVKDFTVESDIINAQVDGIVKGAKVVNQEYMSDGTVEVTVRMPLAGDFSQIIIPRIVEKKQKMAPAPPPPPPAPTPPEVSAPAPTPPAPSAAVVYTGMVVDARGIQARPAMSPRIFDEDGKEIYGSMNVDREYAVRQGMSGYARDLTAAQSNARVTNNPISVKGLKAEGPGRTDIVISNADAARIRNAGENMNFLKQCRVMIVLD